MTKMLIPGPSSCVLVAEAGGHGDGSQVKETSVLSEHAVVVAMPVRPVPRHTVLHSESAIFIAAEAATASMVPQPQEPK